MDPLTKKMIEYLLDHGRDSGELHAAVADAVGWIEDHPYATSVTDVEDEEGETHG